jgi:hypothetical protein
MNSVPLTLTQELEIPSLLRKPRFSFRQRVNTNNAVSTMETVILALYTVVIRARSLIHFYTF